MRKNLKEARQKAGMKNNQSGEYITSYTEDKIQTGLRVPEKQYNRIKEQAERMGVSINQLILILIDIGLNFLEMKQPE